MVSCGIHSNVACSADFGYGIFSSISISRPITVHYQNIQPRRNLLLCATSERDYKQQHWVEMLASPRQNTIMPLSDLLHRVCRCHDFWLNIGCFAIEKRVKRKFSSWILLPVITKYVRPYFQLLVDKGLIEGVWISSCINSIYYSTCLHHRLSNMHRIWCLHYVGENLEGKKMAKHVVEWYNSIGFFNKQTYMVPVNPIVIIFWH